MLLGLLYLLCSSALCVPCLFKKVIFKMSGGVMVSNNTMFHSGVAPQFPNSLSGQQHYRDPFVWWPLILLDSLSISGVFSCVFAPLSEIQEQWNLLLQFRTKLFKSECSCNGFLKSCIKELQSVFLFVLLSISLKKKKKVILTKWVETSFKLLSTTCEKHSLTHSRGVSELQNCRA